MAGDAKKLQPIIIKRIKKGGHAAHGGAWKIAYADFVTAMMAFFLLMWLLGSTSEGDKKGLADYFASPLKVAMMGGSGAGDANSVVKGGGEDISKQAGQTQKSDATDARRRGATRQVRQEQRQAEAARLEAMRAKLQAMLAADPKLAAMKGQVRLEMTADGLRIQIADEHNRAMFDSGSAVVRPHMRELLRTIGEVLAEVPNRLTLEGHTDAAAFGGGGRGYGNWELSSDRANASRRELVAGGLPEGRVLRVLGLAASMPQERNDPASPANRRISVIVMNRDAEDRLFRTLPGEVPNDVEPPGTPEPPRPLATAVPVALAR